MSDIKITKYEYILNRLLTISSTHPCKQAALLAGGNEIRRVSDSMGTRQDYSDSDAVESSISIDRFNLLK